MSEGPRQVDAGVLAAVRIAGSSTRKLVRQARARYTCDLLTWPYRREFDEIWSTVDFVPGWFNEGSAAFLYRLIRAEQPSLVVEIGSYLGRSTTFFAMSLRRLVPGGHVVAVDPHTGDRQQLERLAAQRLPSFDLFQQHISALGLQETVETRVATSLTAAKGWSRPVDLLYVDGWHSYDAVCEDGRAWLPHLRDRGVVVFDDYAAYPEVARAVHNLADAGQFHLWGTIFGQAVGGNRDEPPQSLRRALRLGRRA